MDGLRDKMKYLRGYKPKGGTKRAVEHEPDLESPPKRQYKGIYPSTESMVITEMHTQATGEDNNSHDRHVKLLQMEERKVSPDMNIVADLMKRTFLIRRTGIMDEPQPVYQLLKVYPFLRKYDQVIQQNYNAWSVNYILTFSC